jgi:anti-anti-sigma regulatory factor
MLIYEHRGDKLAIAGAIDDKADVLGLMAHAKDGQLVLDLGGIRFINSLGVREWIRLQQAAAKANVQIELHRVAVVIVHQLNIVVATRGTAIVHSFFAPYLCEECDAEHDMVLDERLHADALAKHQPPPMSCPECKRAMEFRDPPELYFSFLAQS